MESKIESQNKLRNFDRIKLAENLTIYRKKKKLTQELLADKISESRGKVTNYESGANLPPINVLTKIADVLEVSLDRLVFGEESRFFSSNIMSSISATKEDKSINNEIEQKGEYLNQTIIDLRREINTLIAYTTRLEKDLQKYEGLS